MAQNFYHDTISVSKGPHNFYHTTAPLPETPEAIKEENLYLSDSIETDLSRLVQESGDTLSLADTILLDLSQVKSEQSDTIYLSDELTFEREVILEDTLYLSDQDEQNIPQLNKELSESIYFSDEISLSLSQQSVELSDTIYLSASTERAQSPVSNATGITYYNNKLYISIDETIGKVVEVDNLTGDPNFAQYIFDQNGETAQNCKSVEVNTSSGHIYVGCISGQIMKCSISDLTSREQLDTGDTDDITSLSTYDVYNYTYAGTDESTGEVLFIDESIKTTISSKFDFLKQYTKSLSATVNPIYAKSLSSKFNAYATQSESLVSDFRFITSASPTPLARTDFHVYIDDVETTDVDLESIKVEMQESEFPTATFILARKHDNPDETIDGTSSEITNDNNVKVYLDTTLIFEGNISTLEFNTQERITVNARSTTISDRAFHTVGLPYQQAGSQLDIYEILNHNITKEKLRTYTEDENDDPETYLGVKINLGEIIEEFSSKGASFENRTTLANDIFLGDWQPEPNRTYFWYASGNNWLTGDSFSGKYLGTSISGISSDTYSLTQAWYKYQRPIKNGKWIYYNGSLSRVLAENDDSYLLSVGWIPKLDPNDKDQTNEDIMYKIGSSPYKEISAPNGANITKRRYEDREDGLYTIKDEGHRNYLYAQEVAAVEYDKLKDVGGNVSATVTNSTIDLTVDSYLYYKLATNVRVNITNTTESGVFKDSNGFPVSIKGITIDSNSMKTTIVCDNKLSKYELDELDDTLPDEDDSQYNIEAIEHKITNKYDPATDSELEELGI